jgi:uncharacterized UBP type Zn finger protein
VLPSVLHLAGCRYAANLEQLDTGRKISANPADWACDETGVKENLWLNLHTGHIGSGRKVSWRENRVVYMAGGGASVSATEGWG